MNKKDLLSGVVVIILLVIFISFYPNKKDKTMIVGLDNYTLTNNVAQTVVDPSFIPIDNNYGLKLFTDGKVLMVYGHKFDNVDPKTVKVLKRDILADKNGVYRIYYGEIKKIDGLLPENIRVVSDELNLLANNTQVYLINESTMDSGKFITNIANPTKLTAIYLDNGKIVTDETKFYIPNFYQLLELKINNPVRIKNTNYIKGSDKIYYGSSIISEADPASFKFITDKTTSAKYLGMDDYQYYYAKDNKNVYYKDEIVLNADLNSFNTFKANYRDEYAYDSKNVYWNGKLISGADPKTFIVLKTQPYEGCSMGDYAKDDNSVYYQTKRIIGADPKTFETITEGFAKDASHSYYNGVEINIEPKDLDPVCSYG